METAKLKLLILQLHTEFIQKDKLAIIATISTLVTNTKGPLPCNSLNPLKATHEL